MFKKGKLLNWFLAATIIGLGVLYAIKTGHDLSKFFAQDFPDIDWSKTIRRSWEPLRQFDVPFVLMSLLLSPFAALRFPYGTLLFTVAVALFVVAVRRRKNKMLLYSAAFVSLLAFYLCGFVVLTT